MGILDIMEEINEKQIQKNQSGEERIIGSLLGIVTDNYNKDYPGRIQVEIPVRNEESNMLRWAKTAHMYSGKNWGQYFQPEIGDQVLLAFEHGNIERPFIIGSVPRENDSFIAQSARKQNELKRLVSKHGNELSFEDKKDGDGEQDKISLHTAGKKHALTMDNEKKQITMQADEKLVIQVGDSIKVTMNGSNGTISIDAQKVVISASKMMEYKTDGTAKFSGQQTIIEASSVLKANSNGMVTVQGSPIKLG